MIISIDGPAASGKSTTAKILSNKLGYIHLNSGLLYRAVTYVFIKNITATTLCKPAYSDPFFSRTASKVPTNFLNTPLNTPAKLVVGPLKTANI